METEIGERWELLVQVVRDGDLVQALATNAVLSGANPLGNRVLQAPLVAASLEMWNANY